MVQLILIGIFGGLYVGVKTESLKHAAATVAGLMGCMFLMGIIPTYIFEALRGYNLEPDEMQAAVAVILFALTFAVATLLIYLADKRIPGALLKKAHLRLTFLFVVISFVGLAGAGKVFIKPEEGEAVTIVINDIPFVLLLVITIFFACQFFFSLENIMKLRAESQVTGNHPSGQGELTISQYKQFAGFCAIISIGFAGTLGPLPFLTIIIFILIALMYFRFVNVPNRIIASLVTGLAGVLIYLTGFLTTTTKIKNGWLVVEPFEMRYPDHGPISISTTAIAVGICIFVIVCVLRFFMTRLPNLDR